MRKEVSVGGRELILSMLSTFSVSQIISLIQKTYSYKILHFKSMRPPKLKSVNKMQMKVKWKDTCPIGLTNSNFATHSLPPCCSKLHHSGRLVSVVSRIVSQSWKMRHSPY